MSIWITDLDLEGQLITDSAESKSESYLVFVAFEKNKLSI